MYATLPPRAPPSTWVAIRALAAEARGLREVRAHSAAGPAAGRGGAGLGVAVFLQRKLALGWGTARVAVGMAFSSAVYERAKTALEEGQPGAWQ